MLLNITSITIHFEGQPVIGRLWRKASEMFSNERPAGDTDVDDEALLTNFIARKATIVRSSSNVC